ncbi:MULTISPECIES: YfbU family protein [Vibrio]|uniref:YfbU family protein n=1 Tax=Vibrio ostreae TaxID=2841925 RepID=A0A975UDA0_9VIBR|nr:MULTISPECIES: YfbU family protein [Vibrio]QXO18344.1 YfbU family protein [Vibrio ostreae]
MILNKIKEVLAAFYNVDSAGKHTEGISELNSVWFNARFLYFFKYHGLKKSDDSEEHVLYEKDAISPYKYVLFVVDVLELFSLLNASWYRLSTEQKHQLHDIEHAFRGFSSAKESKYLEALKIITVEMMVFSEFSHNQKCSPLKPMVEQYRRMLTVFELMGRPIPLSYPQLCRLLAVLEIGPAAKQGHKERI